MDVVSLKVLEEIKKIDMFKDAVIAGGACRDHILGGTFEDIDVFFPVKSHRDFGKFPYAELEEKEFTVVGGNDFLQYGVDNRQKIDLLYKNKIKVDLVGVIHKESNFADNLIEEFDYSINQMYYDDNKGEIVATPEAYQDTQRRQATLIRCNHPSDLYRSVMRFHKWHEKYPELRFNTTLEFKNNEESTKEEQPREEPRVQLEGNAGWLQRADEQAVAAAARHVRQLEDRARRQAIAADLFEAEREGVNLAPGEVVWRPFPG